MVANPCEKSPCNILSVSPHRDRFVLKGAVLLNLWAPTPYRATGGLDLLGHGDARTGAELG
jgi:hypothetical protein